MAGERDFQEKLRRLGTLVGELDQVPGGGSKVAARELVQLLMEVHGTGLERMLEIVFESEAGGEALIGKLGQDPIVRNLLLLYALHPEELETRILRAVEIAGARLRKFDAQLEVVSLHDGAIRLRLHASGHACGSTMNNLKAMVEECLYDQAPDLASLSIAAPQDDAEPGFVPIESLIKQASEIRAEVDGGD